MKTVVYESIQEINPAEWDALDDGNPFQSHAFFSALELSQSVGPNTGWIPLYFTLQNDVSPEASATSPRDESVPLNTQRQEIVACAATFLKGHSMGEFVYDFSWAKEAERYGIQYYPKLVITSPFSPVTGGRIHGRSRDAKATLVEEIVAFSRSMGCAGVHVLFHELDERDSSPDHGDNAPERSYQSPIIQENFALRTSFQFQWENQNYGCFDDFLAKLRSRRRKEIRRERRALQDQGVNLQAIPGSELTAEDARRIADFYRGTCDRYTWGNAYLAADFFRILIEKIPGNITFFAAIKDGKTIAGAFCLHSDTHLYGRYWGYAEHVPFLHFETCLYTPIEWAIVRGIKVFEPGAGGDHKFSRGFLPTKTYSSHQHFHPGFNAALKRFCSAEAIAVEEEISTLLIAESPYQRG